jgi:hypothetical protein
LYILLEASIQERGLVRSYGADFEAWCEERFLCGRYLDNDLYHFFQGSKQVITSKVLVCGKNVKSSKDQFVIFILVPTKGYNVLQQWTKPMECILWIRKCLIEKSMTNKQGIQESWSLPSFLVTTQS